MTRSNEGIRTIPTHVAILLFVLVIYPVSALGPVDIGCYQVDKDSPVFRTSGGNYDPDSVRHEECIYACYLQSASYSGLRAGHCLCADSTFGTDVSLSCGDPCPGDFHQSCGNDTHIAMSTKRIPRAPPVATLSITPDPVVAKQAVQLIADDSADLGSYVELQFDPGDAGSQVTWMTSTNISHVYVTSGKFVALLTIRQYSLLTAHSAVTVTVTMKAANLCLKCPVVVETGKPFECSIEVILGSGLTMSMSIGDVELLSQKIGDSKLTTLGVLGQSGSPAPDTPRTWILPATESMHKAKLLGVDVLITDVGSGSFNLLILKPVCSGKTYCATDNLCHSDSLCKYGTGLRGSPLTQDSCDSSTVHATYCITQQACRQNLGNMSCPEKATRFETNIIAGIKTDRPNYEVVDVIKIDVSNQGLLHFSFTDPGEELLILDVGHVIGLSIMTGGPNIGVQSDHSTTDALEYKSTTDLGTLSAGATLQISNFNLDSSRHALRAIAVNPVISQPQLTINTVGDFDLVANLTNVITPSGVFETVNVSVQSGIMGLQYTNLVGVVRPYDNLTLVLSVLSGSHINYKLDWGDESTVEEIYFLNPDPFNISHVYSVAHIYELNVVASNAISNQTLQGFLRVQNPVLTEHFSITMESPQGVDGDGTPTVVDVVITVTKPAVELLATDPQATFKCHPEVAYPEGRVANLSHLTSDGQSIRHPMSFTTKGQYSINVTIYNFVSDAVYTVKVTFYEKLKNVSSILRYKPSESISSESVIGHGPLQNIFPFDRPVIFNMSYTFGSEVTYIVDFGDNSSPGNYSHGSDEFYSFDHEFPEKISSYEVTISTSNPVTPPVQKKITVSLIEPIRAVNIKDLGISRANETRELNLTMQLVGTDSCVVIDYGDGTPTEAYGRCKRHLNWKGILQPWVNISHVFQEQRSYEVQAMGSNNISSSKVTVLIPVLEGKKYCGLPDVSVQDSSLGWWLPKVAVRKSRLVFQGTTKLNCWFTDNTKSWSVERLDPQTGAVIDANSTELGHTTTSTLVIHPFMLSVGLYRLAFKVTMNITLTYGIEVSAVGYEYFDIQRSQLIVGIFEGQATSIVRGLGSNLTLIPGLVSKDPDVPPSEGEDQGFEKFLYLCRRLTEQYPAESSNITIPDPSENITEGKGGCFGTGPGILNYSTPTLSWDTSLMETDVEFELMVIITKDIRRGNFSLTVEIKKGDPPEVAINIGKGTVYLPGNGAQIINPTGSIRLTATCLKFCSGIHYHWNMTALTGSGKREIDFPRWTTGITSEFLYIKKDLFTQYPHWSLFRIMVHATNDKHSSSYAGMKIQLNEPPKSGDCTVDRDSIVAKETVRVRCEGWTDWEGIVQYRYFVQTAIFEASLLNSVKSDVVLTPPVGSEIDDYMVSLGVTAEDHLGATTTLIFANITVTPPLVSLENFTSQQVELYSRLEWESNPTAITAQLLLDASMLDVLTASTQNGSSDTEVGEETGSTQSQDVREQKSEIISRMVKLQASISVNSAQDIVLQSSTIALISKDVSALSPGALDFLASVAYDMVVFAENDTEARNDESKLNSVGKGIVSFLGNVIEGAGESFSNPIVTASSSEGVTADPEEDKIEAAEKADAILLHLENVAHNLYSVTVANKLPGEEPTRFSSSNVKLYIDRNKASELMNGTTVKDTIGEVKIGGWCELRNLKDKDCTDNETVSLKLQSTSKNSYTFAAGSQPDRKDSGVVNITFFSSENEEYEIKDLKDDLIDIHFSQADSCTQEEFKVFDLTMGNSSFYHRIDVESVGESIFIEILPGSKSTVYTLIMSFDKVPTPEEHEFKFQIPNKTEDTESSTFFLQTGKSTEAVTVSTTHSSRSSPATLVASTPNSATEGTEPPTFTSSTNNSRVSSLSSTADSRMHSSASSTSTSNLTSSSTVDTPVTSFSTGTLMPSTTDSAANGAELPTSTSSNISSRASSLPSFDSSSASTADSGMYSPASSTSTSDLISTSTADTPVTSPSTGTLMPSTTDSAANGTELPTSTSSNISSRASSLPSFDSSSASTADSGMRSSASSTSTSNLTSSSTVETPVTSFSNGTLMPSTTDSAANGTELPTSTSSNISSRANATTSMPGESSSQPTDIEPVSHIVIFGPDQHKGKKGRYLFKLAELDENGIPQNFTTNYSLRILQAECAFFQSDARNWSTEGVRTVLDPQTKCPICQSSHLTPFTTSWIVKPVPLDWDQILANISPLDSATIYATCIVIYVLFFFIFSWARRKDKKDVMLLGVSPLPDNNPSHSHLYELVVITGKRLNSGTDSKVSFILSGDDDETPPRCLEDPKRGILCRGGTDRFLLATAKPLGTLNYMRIWHDNSGQGAAQSWYLSYIIVRDLQTKRRYFFIANQWFSLVDGDGQVDRLLPVAGREQMREFGHVFSSQTGKHFNDGHLWISIVTRPPGSRFTRMQRTMCCLMALWLELLTSVMFYRVGSGGIASHTFSIGPFSMSPSEIAIGIQSNLIVFPISLLMVQFFKKSRLRWKRPSRIQVAKESQTKKFISDNKVHPLKTAKDDSDTLQVSSRDVYIISDHGKINVDSPKTDQGKTPDPKVKKPQHWSFPWWFIPIAWIVCFLTTFTATFFTLLYGLQLGNSEASQWLRSVIISFFCGVILTQPIKVILMSLFIALVFKTPNADEDVDMEEDEEDCQLQGDEEWLHTLYGSSNIHPAAKAPLEPHVLENQRIKRIKELKMYAIIREILFSIIFVWILSVFSYGNQDPFAFWTKNAHVKLLVHGDGNHTLMKATSIPKFWKWVDNSLVPGMYAGEWYNGDPPSPDEHLFLGDRYSKILGRVIFRQLRVPKGDCQVNSKMKGMVKECNIGYSGGRQDKSQYGIGWSPYDNTTKEYPQYKFTEAEDLNSYTTWGKHALYRGGGYVYRINTESVDTVRATMDQMYEEAWIDRYTRAVFIEFSVYNAQTNLFSFINLMMEILPTGGSYPHYRIDVLRLLTYHEGIGLVRLLCEITFFVFIICMTIRELLQIRKEGKAYFKLFWNLNEVAIICMSIAIMIIYLFRLFVTNSLLETFKDREKRKHVNLQHVAYWNELIGYVLGIVVFFSTLKFLKLLRFNRRIGLLSSTIRSCSEELFNFTFMFSFVFVAFASAFYLIFCNRLLNYSDILSTMETMITAVLGKFKFGELLNTEGVLGPLFFFGFTGYVCFVMINMFLAIIIGAFKTVKEDLVNQSNDYEMVDFILNRFKALTGIKSKEEDLPNLDMEEYEADPAKSLPDKVDQLLESIARTYFDHGTNDFAKEMNGLEEKKESSKHGRKIFLS